MTSSLHSSALLLFLLAAVISFPSCSCSASTCHSGNDPSNGSNGSSGKKIDTLPCPPFSSSPSYPFSSSLGCGHPAFHVNCSSPHSTISINNVSFSIVSYESSSSSLHLSPIRASASTCPNVSSVIPSNPVNFSGSPFKVSKAFCSRLLNPRPCSSHTLPNCSLCSWECSLIRNPTRLLRGCSSSLSAANDSDSDSDARCRGDILGFLDSLLGFGGIEVEWDQFQDSYFSDCKACRSRSGVCGYNSSHPNKPFMCFGILTRAAPPWISPHVIALLVALLGFATLMLVAVAAFLLRTRRMPQSNSESEDPTAIFLHRHRTSNPLPPVFTYEELQISTNSFDPKRKIGDGGFGSVYLGKLQDGRVVAVKHLFRHETGKCKSAFCNEILILSSMNHPNLVKLHGYCSDPRGLVLVYDYVPNGTLADHLHRRKSSLTWQVRLDIALQVASAMEYLHFTVKPAVVHRDITSCNIFVERDMRIKVGDFGLSRILTFTETSSREFVCTGPQGTPGYLDPDYHKCFRLTEKSDVYSFGVVLLELVSGMRALDQRREKREMALADLVVSKIQMGMLNQVVDSRLLNGDVLMEGVDAVAELAFRCVAADKDDRPDSREVVAELKRIRSRARVPQ